MTTHFETSLNTAIQPWGIVPGEDQMVLLHRYFQSMLETNKQFNLTRITDPAEAAIKLFADSLSVIAWAEQAGINAHQMADAGTGAGFPAAPVAILHPTWSVEAIDSTAKKINFVQQAANDLNIPNLKSSHTRIEYLRPENPYDLITFKAVGPIASCLRWAQHAVAKGGHVVLFKTAELSSEEEQQGKETTRKTGYEELSPFGYTLHWNGEPMHRVLRIYRRVK